MELLTYCGIFGIPTIFLVLCIKNIVEIVQSKKDNVTVKRSLIVKSIIFGLIFVLIVVFYIWFVYITNEIAKNM